MEDELIDWVRRAIKEKEDSKLFWNVCYGRTPSLKSAICSEKVTDEEDAEFDESVAKMLDAVRAVLNDGHNYVFVSIKRSKTDPNPMTRTLRNPNVNRSPDNQQITALGLLEKQFKMQLEHQNLLFESKLERMELERKHLEEMANLQAQIDDSDKKTGIAGVIDKAMANDKIQDAIAKLITRIPRLLSPPAPATQQAPATIQPTIQPAPTEPQISQEEINFLINFRNTMYGVFEKDTYNKMAKLMSMANTQPDVLKMGIEYLEGGEHEA